MKINSFVKRITPPGYSRYPGLSFGFPIIMGFFCSLSFISGFSRHFNMTLRYLYEDPYTMQILKSDAEMFPFGMFTKNLGWSFTIVMGLFLLDSLWSYLYFTKSTNSIYLMKRIPRKETIIRCFAYPAYEIAVLLLFLAISVGICVLIYFSKVPSECLPDWQYFSLWEVMIWSN